VKDRDIAAFLTGGFLATAVQNICAGSKPYAIASLVLLMASACFWHMEASK